MNFITLLFIVFLILFSVGVGFGIKSTSEQSDKCMKVGGVPSLERGVYKACMKPDSFIKIN